MNYILIIFFVLSISIRGQNNLEIIKGYEEKAINYVLTSKKAKGRKRSIVAIVKGTQSDLVISHVLKIKRRKDKSKGGYLGYGRLHEADCQKVFSRCFPGRRLFSCSEAGYRSTPGNQD